METQVKAILGQSLLDIAVQECGGLDTLVDVAIDNNVSITDDLEAGVALSVNSISNADVQRYYKIRGIKPATTLTEDIEESGEGIGYWAIEDNFVVSPNEETGEGIGYWTIGKDFVVSADNVLGEGIGYWSIGNFLIS